MAIGILNPYVSSGFILKHETENEYAIVDLSCASDQGIKGELKERGIPPECIGLVALTHLHLDHASPAAVRTILAMTSCPVLISEIAWQHAINPEVRQVRNLIKTSGRLELLDPIGEAQYGSWATAWRPLSHAVNDVNTMGGNHAFRINDAIITGDGPVRDLFTASNIPFLCPFEGGPVKTLAINLAHLSLEDMNDQDFPEARKKRWREEHGLVEELTAAIRDPQFNPFFKNLDLLVPTHFRRQPRAETETRYTAAIEEARAEKGFAFKLAYEDSDV